MHAPTTSMETPALNKPATLHNEPAGTLSDDARWVTDTRSDTYTTQRITTPRSLVAVGARLGSLGTKAQAARPLTPPHHSPPTRGSQSITASPWLCSGGCRRRTHCALQSTSRRPVIQSWPTRQQRAVIAHAVAAGRTISLADGKLSIFMHSCAVRSVARQQQRGGAHRCAQR